MYTIVRQVDGGFEVMNPYVNDKIHFVKELDKKPFYVSWEPIDYKAKIISLKKITALNVPDKYLQTVTESNTEDVIWNTYLASQYVADELDIRMKLSKEFKKNLLNLTKTELADFVITKLFEKYFGSITKNNFTPMHIDNLIHKKISGGKLTQEAVKMFKANKRNTIEYRGLELKYGNGGLHAVKKGIHIAEPYEIFVDIDVNSFYATLIANSEQGPCGTNGKFKVLINELKQRRNESSFYKFCLTYLYGNICSKNSAFYDWNIQTQTVVNGQLMLTELIESVCTEIQSCVPIMVNTDGIIVRIPVSRAEDLNRIVTEWCSKFNLETKSKTYTKLIIRDVNNYIAVGSKLEVNNDQYSDMKTLHPEYYFSSLGEHLYYAPVKYSGVYRYFRKGLTINPKSELYKAVAEYYLYDIEQVDDEVKKIICNVQRPLDVKQLEIFK